MDPSCSYLVCSYSNKSICVHDFVTGDMVVQGMGHGEVITGVIFTPDCKRIISVSFYFLFGFNTTDSRKPILYVLLI